MVVEIICGHCGEESTVEVLKSARWFASWPVILVISFILGITASYIGIMIGSILMALIRVLTYRMTSRCPKCLTELTIKWT